MAEDWRRSGSAILRYSFLHAFANDTTMDADELAMIEGLALKDGIVDDQERGVLGRMFARVNEQSVSKEVWEEICRFKSEHRIP